MKNYSMCFIDFCRLRRLIRLFKFAILVYQSSVSTVFMFMLDSSNMLTVIFWMENDNYKSIAIVPAFFTISHA